jgi:hypothetical protein
MAQITHLRDQNSPKILNVTLKIEGAHRIVIATRALCLEKPAPRGACNARGI